VRQTTTDKTNMTMHDKYRKA